MLSFSDIVVQIVDARNPLLFRCEDLVRQCFVLFLQVHGFHHCALQLLLLKCSQLWSNVEHKLLVLSNTFSNKEKSDNFFQELNTSLNLP